MRPKVVRLPDRRVWLRVADPAWDDQLDPSHAAGEGGRWNSPGSHPTLYTSADIRSALLQIERMLDGQPARIDDLGPDAYLLVALTLPARQDAADAVSDEGLEALGLPASYPVDPKGAPVRLERCQPVGAAVRARGVRGVWGRSACTVDGRGRELAWFPASRRSRARPVWDEPRPLGAWIEALEWEDIGLPAQPDPEDG